MKIFDLTGIGLNSVDTLVLARRFPAYAGKEPFDDEIVSPGGQIASALVAAARLGLSTRYVGTVGSDRAGQLQLESLRDAGVDVGEVQLMGDPVPPMFWFTDPEGNLIGVAGTA